MHGERPLHAHAEGVLADRERLAHALALALDHHALEDLRPPAIALDDLEVHAHPVPGRELGNAPELRALEAVDDGAHGEKKPRRRTAAFAERATMVAKGSESYPRCRLCSNRHCRMRS
jgi:hypothetical protein